MTQDLTASCLWRARNELVVALDRQLGEPVDCYVNGSVVWLRDDGPSGIALEWRLHPIAGFARPEGYDTYDLFSRVALAIATDGDHPPVSMLWDGLEVFAAYDDNPEPPMLALAAEASLGLSPDAYGLVDHDAIGDVWERTAGGISVVNELINQLQPRD